MIKQWSYLLNRYNVEIRNEDILELVKDKNISNDTLIYLDPPYLGVDYVYNKDNSNHFQIELLNQTQRFKYRVYSNENCKELYELGIDKYFSYVLKFERNTKLGHSNKDGLEFLGCSKSEPTQKFSVNNPKDHIYIDYAFANFEQKPKREEDFEMMFEMLKSDNAYLRNAAILFLQQYGKEVKQFIQKLMNSDDKDIRIFAINILGDVNFEESLDMLREFIKKETDINALMTAIDYMGEIGEEEDIKLLEEIKNKFNDDYINFGVDLAIDRIKA
jgi:hypothetical protein